MDLRPPDSDLHVRVSFSLAMNKYMHNRYTYYCIQQSASFGSSRSTQSLHWFDDIERQQNADGDIVLNFSPSPSHVHTNDLHEANQPVIAEDEQETRLRQTQSNRLALREEMDKIDEERKKLEEDKKKFYAMQATLAKTVADAEAKNINDATDKAALDAKDKAAQDAKDKAAQDAKDKETELQAAQDARDKAAQDARDKVVQDAENKETEMRRAQDSGGNESFKSASEIESENKESRSTLDVASQVGDSESSSDQDSTKKEAKSRTAADAKQNEKKNHSGSEFPEDFKAVGGKSKASQNATDDEDLVRNTKRHKATHRIFEIFGRQENNCVRITTLKIFVGSISVLMLVLFDVF